MAKEQTENQILEQQKAESLASFREKIVGLQAEIKKLEAIKSNIAAELRSHFENRAKELQLHEEELRARLSFADDKSATVIANLKESEIRLENAKALELSLMDKHSFHDEKIESHHIFIEQQKEIVRDKHSECLDREEKSKLILDEAHQRWDLVVANEISIEKKANDLVHIQNNITEDIESQKKIRLENEALLREINKQRTDIENIKNKSEFDKQESIKIRDDCDIQTARLAKRKLELDEKEKYLKSMGIRQEVIGKSQEQRQQQINDEAGKLNQLKIDVEILLKQKEAKEAENGS